MKFKTTKREILQGYSKTICISYCGLQHLLCCENASAYIANCDGWRADIYIFDSTAIITGYAPFGAFRPSYELCQKYENKAALIRQNCGADSTKCKAALKPLIDEFIREVIPCEK